MGDRSSAGMPAATVRDARVRREPLFQKLKPGPGRSPEQVVANQRARLYGAMIELVAERGYSRVTVRELSRLAGVSTKSFYECFENVEACFVATYARIIRDAVRRPADVSPAPEDHTRTRLRNFFTALGEDSKAAGLVLVDAPSTGPVLAAQIRCADRALERFLADELVGAANPTPFTEALIHGTAAAAMQVARSRRLSDGPTLPAAAADEFGKWLLSLRAGSCLQERPLHTFVATAGDAPLPPRSGGIGDARHFLIAAVIKLGARDGYAALTAPAIRREAGVSRRCFDERFDSVADCFLAAVETKMSIATRRAEKQAVGAGSWERGVVRAIAALAAEFRRDPALVRLGFVDILAPGRSGLELRERILAAWSRRLRRTAPKHLRPGRMAAEASVAAATSIAAAPHLDRVGQAAPAAAFVVLAPAIGAAAAQRVIGAELGARADAGESKNI